jgi:hypothetical protein
MNKFPVRDYYKNKIKSSQDRFTIVGKTKYGKPISKQNLYKYYDICLKYISEVSVDERVLELGSGTGLFVEYFYTNVSKNIFFSDPFINTLQYLPNDISLQLASNYNNYDLQNLSLNYDPQTLGECMFAFEVIQHIPINEFYTYVNKMSSLGLSHCYIGGVLDYQMKKDLSKKRPELQLNDSKCDNIFGYWYEKSTFKDLFSRNFNIFIIDQPSFMHTYEYRYDLILERK